MYGDACHAYECGGSKEVSEENRETDGVLSESQCVLLLPLPLSLLISLFFLQTLSAVLLSS